MSRRKRDPRTTIVVHYLIDGCMARDELKTRSRHNVKIMPDGRGYVKTAEADVLYASVERITVRDGRR